LKNLKLLNDEPILSSSGALKIKYDYFLIGYKLKNDLIWRFKFNFLRWKPIQLENTCTSCSLLPSQQRHGRTFPLIMLGKTCLHLGSCSCSVLKRFPLKFAQRIRANL